MTPEQVTALYAILPIADPTSEFHHGDCLGADAQAHDMAVGCGCRTVSHPPIKDDLRAFKKADEIREPKSYLARNRDIVRETEFVIAAPKEFTEQPKGGTWYTVRFARESGKRLCVIRPDGTLTN
jgi:hypothetical protein